MQLTHEEKQMVKAIKRANFVFVCGNGGSASTAEHLTNDLFSRGIKAICLNSNVAIMTMIANDYEYEAIFGQQIARYAEPGDLLITISCSGISPNIKYVQNTASELGVTWFDFPTFDELERSLPHNDRPYEDLENKHMELVHKLRKALK